MEFPADYLRETLTIPRIGLAPLEACAIMDRWSTLPASADPWGFPRLHSLPNGSSRLVLGARADPFCLPWLLRRSPRDSFPASFFRRSQSTATAFDAAVSIFLTLRTAGTDLPLGVILARLMTAISGVAQLPSGFSPEIRGFRGAERSIRPLAHRLARLVFDEPGRPLSLDEALHSALYLDDSAFSALAPTPPGSPGGAAYSDGHSDPMSDPEDDRAALPPGEATNDRLLDALFRVEAGLTEALAEPTMPVIMLRAQHRFARLERITARLGAWVQGCAALAAARTLPDPE